MVVGIRPIKPGNVSGCHNYYSSEPVIYKASFFLSKLAGQLKRPLAVILITFDPAFAHAGNAMMPFLLPLQHCCHHYTRHPKGLLSSTHPNI